MEVPLSNFFGHKVKAADGYIGTISDFGVDVRLWIIPFIIIDAAERLKSEVILSSKLLLPIHEATKTFPAKVTLGRMSANDNALSEWLTDDRPTHLLHRPQAMYESNENICRSTVSSSSNTLYPVLRRLKRGTALTGTIIKSADTVLGKICDYVLEDSTWQIRYLVIKVFKIISARCLLIDTKHLKNIKWSENSLELNL